MVNETTMPRGVKAFLVDDEADGREILQEMLTRHRPIIQIVGQASNVDQAARMIQELRPELVFLDVQMPGRNGFELLSELSPIEFEVIFVTSYEQYAISAIRNNALDYLLKPIDQEDLMAAVDKAISRVTGRPISTDNNTVLDDQLNRSAQMIAVHHRNKVQMINVESIIHVEALDNYCKIYTLVEGDYIITRSLKEVASLFGVDSSFVRISKTVLINIKYINNYSKGEPCMISTTNGKVFEISRRKKHAVLAELTVKLLGK